jgi:EmrB/QacA subfamily drug resistance transporter
MRTLSGSGSDERMSNKTLSLVLSSMVGFLIAFMSSSLNVALPTISNEFGSSAILLSWMVTVFVLAMAVFSVPFGRIADIVGIKKVYIGGCILFTLGAVAAMFSDSSGTLIACRALLGLGAAMAVGNSVALITAVYPAGERGRALGINVASVYTGSAMGPFLGGVLTEHFGWRSIFFINVPVGLAVTVLLLWRIKGEWRECQGEKFDYIGSTIYGLSMIALIYGFSSLPDLSGGVTILAGLVGLAAFFKWEGRIKSPVININIFRNNRAFIFSNLAALINYSSLFAVSFLLSLYLQYIKGLTPELAGVTLIFQPVIQAALSPFAGRLSDRIEPRIVTSAGMALTCLALLSFTTLNEYSSLVQVVVSLIVLGAGFALFASPNTNAIMTSVEPRYYGVASATMFTVRNMGCILSMGATMIIMTMVIGRVVITPEYYSRLVFSTRISFSISAALCFLGIFISLSRGTIRKGES